MAKVSAHLREDDDKFCRCVSIFLLECAHETWASASPLGRCQDLLVAVVHCAVRIVPVPSNDQAVLYCFQNPHDIFHRCASHACDRGAVCFVLNEDEIKGILN